MAKLPEFKTDDEFFEFVETHDTADYWDEFEDVPNVKVKRPKKKAITIRLYPYLIAETKKMAAQYGMPYQALIGQWLAERLSQGNCSGHGWMSVCSEPRSDEQRE